MVKELEFKNLDLFYIKRKIQVMESLLWAKREHEIKLSLYDAPKEWRKWKGTVASKWSDTVCTSVKNKHTFFVQLY
jgi:hypothetical protein